MRVLWHGAPPWLPTGYASQCAIWCRRMKAAGHDVTISSVSGLIGMVMEWEGIPVLPNPPELLANPLIMQRRLERVKPDVVFTHCDHGDIIAPELFAPFKTVSFIASDGDRLGYGDAQFLQRSRATPWAISRHTQRLLEDAGYDAPYVPHAIDCSVFTPPADRAALRAEIGLGAGVFAVGINARNIDPQRKALSEQIAAFARYHKRNPDARLFLHSINVEPSHSSTPTDLHELTLSLGLKQPAVTISEQEQMYLEMFPQADLVKWYGVMDVVMNASRAEGFGLAAIEAQACGTPVILADNSTGPELQGPGWLVPCDHDHWNARHKSWYGKPLGKPMTEALAKAASVGNVGSKREACRQFAAQFDIESVWPLFDKALGELAG